MTKPSFQRHKNTQYRSREFLTPDEITELLQAAQTGRKFRDRNYALILMMFRHGLRAGEAATLKWDAISFSDKTIYINRLKNSQSGNHPLLPDEIEILQILRERYKQDSFHVFVGERGKRMSEDAIAKVMERLGKIAKLDIKVHPHMMRHSCGYWLANQGATTRDIQEYLGHRNIQHTVRYTSLNAERFRSFNWELT
jgi:integrase